MKKQLASDYFDASTKPAYHVKTSPHWFFALFVPRNIAVKVLVYFCTGPTLQPHSAKSLATLERPPLLYSSRSVAEPGILPRGGGADCSTSTSLSAPSDSRRARSRRLARSRGSHRGSDDRDQPSSSLACRVAARRPPRPRAARQQGASYGRIQELVAAAFPGPDAWTVDSSIAWWAPEDQNN